jgi:O-antigen ligase
MGFFNWLLRLSLLIYAGYLIDSSYFSHAPAPHQNALLLAFLAGYIVWFCVWETTAVALLVFLIPLSAVVPRLFSLGLPPFHVFFTSTFILAVAVAPLIRAGCQRFVSHGVSDGILRVSDPLMSAPRSRLELFFTSLTAAWVAVCIISFVFVSLRYTNLYPFSGDPFYDYVINRLGSRSSEGRLIARLSMASYVNSAVFALYVLKSRVNGAVPGMWLKALFGSYSCVGVVAFLQSHYQLGFLAAGGVWPATQRLNATFDDPNALACSLILLFPLAVLGLFYLTGVGRVLALLGAGSSLYLLYVAASRTAFAGFVLGLVTLASLLGWRALRKRHYLLVIVLVFLGITILTGSILLLEKGPRDVLLLSRVGAIWDYLEQNWNKEPGFSKIGDLRSLWWPSAIRMFKENPLTGVGIGVFQFETVNHGAPSDSAGNQYLQMLAGYGIWGALLTAGLFIALIYRLGSMVWNAGRGANRDYLWETSLAAALVSFSVSLLFGSHLLFSQVAFLFGLVLGCFLREPREDAPSQQARISKRWTLVPAVASLLFLVAQASTISYSNPADFRKEQIGREQDIFGYPPEKWDGRFEFRWLTSVNSKRIRVGQRVVKYALYTGNPEASSAGVTVSFFLNDRRLQTIRLNDHNWHTQAIEMPSDMIGKDAVLKVVVDRTWRPPGEYRDLGVALREIGGTSGG